MLLVYVTFEVESAGDVVWMAFQRQGVIMICLPIACLTTESRAWFNIKMSH